MHDLQCNQLLSSDYKMLGGQTNAWSNICNQVMGSHLREIPRLVGERVDIYDLVVVAFILYILNARDKCKRFLLSMSKVICRRYEKLSILSMKLWAVVTGVQTLMDTLLKLSGEKCLVEINI